MRSLASAAVMTDRIGGQHAPDVSVLGKQLDDALQQERLALRFVRGNGQEGARATQAAAEPASTGSTTIDGVPYDDLGYPNPRGSGGDSWVGNEGTSYGPDGGLGYDGGYVGNDGESYPDF
jgi:hypothetical protein